VTPKISVFNRQRTARINVATLRDFGQRALAACLERPRRKSGRLANLEQVDVVLVSDKRIAEIHRRFMNEPSPTDVITFQHGEIVISVETARRQARQFGTALDHELRLYIAHGLLHLHGFDDKTSAGAAEMRRVQERLIASLP
jgi:probable rRNA maturation factor